MSITGKGSEDSGNHWISISDMMTGLMVIFMFIAIAFMIDVLNDKKEQNIIFEEFKQVQENLFDELEKEFEEEFQNWDMELDRDLSIRFTNVDVLFDEGDYTIQKQFGKILDEFLPRYFEVLRQEKYRENIMEIRIEGHSDNTPINPKRGYDKHPYIGNVQLSQERARSVMKHFMVSPYFTRLDRDEKRQLEYWLTANGLSYGRMLNLKGKLQKEHGGQADPDQSRRVEFRIVTASEKVVQQVLDRIRESQK